MTDTLGLNPPEFYSQAGSSSNTHASVGSVEVSSGSPPSASASYVVQIAPTSVAQLLLSMVTTSPKLPLAPAMVDPSTAITLLIVAVRWTSPQVPQERYSLPKS